MVLIKQYSNHLPILPAFIALRSRLTTPRTHVVSTNWTEVSTAAVPSFIDCFWLLTCQYVIQNQNLSIILQQPPFFFTSQFQCFQKIFVWMHCWILFSNVLYVYLWRYLKCRKMSKLLVVLFIKMNTLCLYCFLTIVLTKWSVLKWNFRRQIAVKAKYI